MCLRLHYKICQVFLDLHSMIRMCIRIHQCQVDLRLVYLFLYYLFCLYCDYCYICFHLFFRLLIDVCCFVLDVTSFFYRFYCYCLNNVCCCCLIFVCICQFYLNLCCRISVCYNNYYYYYYYYYFSYMVIGVLIDYGLYILSLIYYCYIYCNYCFCCSCLFYFY